MSTFNTRCPHCNGVNRVPEEKLNEQAKCGRCQQPLLDGRPVEGTSDNFDALLKSEQTVVVDFWAPWCGPCVNFAPVFEQVANEQGSQARFIKVDTEAQQALAAQYGIRSIPTIMVFRNGERVNMINGALPKVQFEQWLAQS
ncbi:thioredoxin TrxC [Vibrio agarivorans]|uniref:Thioredoxin n=1 Tax=Vibrio agarivorans TaxID=153622 RepID=A0ABT7Y590_9VIBR|nr:thioredoxin TrxC [Vibrio agarivorans]MDN2483219.1 thioredoxin TrxC [Vibrio agarivorans]